MKENGISIAVFSIAIVALSAAMFMLWPDRDNFFWTTYVFSIVAVLSVAGNVLYRSANNKQFASNLTLVTISAVYLVVNVLCSIIFLFALKVGSTAYVVTHIVLLAVFAIIWLLGKTAVRHINNQDR